MRPAVSVDGALCVSRETEARLRVLMALIREWTLKINLVARNALDDLWRRHIVDCAQLIDIAPPQARYWVDLGAGAGLPALVVALVAQERRPALRMTAIESDARKCAFMAEAARQLDVGLTIKNRRIEAVAPSNADIVSARALAPLSRLLGYAAPHLAAQGVGLFPKGARHDMETREALRHWRFQHDAVRSKTESDAAILLIRSPHRASA